MEDEQRLRLEYDRSTQLVASFADTRFKLLALVPTIAGAGIGFLSATAPPIALLAIGLLGSAATAGVLMYELENGVVVRGTLRRLRELEAHLFGHAVPGDDRGRAARLFGVVPISQHRAIALVYGAALGAWSYVVVWGALRILDVPNPRAVGFVVGLVFGLVVWFEVERVEGRDTASDRRA